MVDRRCCFSTTCTIITSPTLTSRGRQSSNITIISSGTHTTIVHAMVVHVWSKCSDWTRVGLTSHRSFWTPVSWWTRCRNHNSNTYRNKCKNENLWQWDHLHLFFQWKIRIRDLWWKPFGSWHQSYIII